LCEDDIPDDDANYKMNPPLRGSDDGEALIEGLLDGTIDFIATDHAPHTEEEKSNGMKSAPFGIVRLETAFPLVYINHLKKEISSKHLCIEWITIKPAQIFRV